MTTTTTPVLSAEDTLAVANLAEHAVACGQLECGHTGRSRDGRVRRAMFLYQLAEVAPEVVADALAREDVAVAAMVGELTRVGQYRPRYTKTTSAGGRNTYTDGPAPILLPSVLLPSGKPIPVSPEREVVWGAIIRGESLNAIAANYPKGDGTPRALETVKSHSGWLKRRTGAHTATAALIALITAGRFDVWGNLTLTDAEAAALMVPVTEDTPEGEDTATEDE